MNDIVQLAERTLSTPELDLILNLFIDLAVLLKGVGVCAEKNRPGDKVNNVAATTEPPMQLFEAQLNA
jgi:hypothetical protein